MSWVNCIWVIFGMLGFRVCNIVDGGGQRW